LKPAISVETIGDQQQEIRQCNLAWLVRQLASGERADQSSHFIRKNYLS